MKKLKLLIILPLIACIFTGCWDQKILEKIGFNLELGVESNPNGLSVSYVSPLIAPDESGKIISIEKLDGVSTLREAREKAKLSSSKKVESGVLDHILFSSELAASGLDDILSVLEREADDPTQSYLVIVDGSPRKLLSSISEFKTKPRSDIYLKSLIESGIESSYIPDTAVHDYDINLFSGTIDLIVPMMKLGNEEVELTGSALFHKDKMVGSINIRETSILLSLMGKKKPMEYICKTVDNTEVSSHKLVGMAVTLKDAKRKIKVTLENGRPIVNISLSYKARCDDARWGIDFTNKEIKANIESKIAENIKDDSMMVLDKCQKAGSDPMGIGDILRANYPNYWSNTTWLKAYQDATFNVDVKLHINSHGLIK
ncbi:Ger(x)C family spore germination protein [Candidatus Clostridium radicumherbarum]|uniref:Ger(X)C family spore germination protein n=1 Tax=Candidatus Clostridium radicumherbarum TaxID=3381662 RepID=A0ABW8TXB8_9CLOT